MIFKETTSVWFSVWFVEGMQQRLKTTTINLYFLGVKIKTTIKEEVVD